MILHDTLAFAILVAAVLVLYGITSFLFHSFEERRADLAKQFGAKGQAALKANQPEQAIADLRTALSYGPDDQSNHLLLALALAHAHHTEEATTYFTALWEKQPADGFINLQLAQLARQRNDSHDAIDYYLASASGSWPTNGDPRRRQVQLELSDYLMQLGHFPAARGELLIAAANTPESAEADTIFGDKLLQAHDPADAMSFYRKALALKPHDAATLERAGNAAFETADYVDAHRWLSLSIEHHRAEGATEESVSQLRLKIDQAARLERLNLSSTLLPEERATHLVEAAAIAKHRLDACSAQWHNQPALPPALQTLSQQWQSVSGLVGSAASLKDAPDQDTIEQLIFNTEEQTSLFCGAPTGDDALLLLLANTSAAQARTQESQ